MGDEFMQWSHGRMWTEAMMFGLDLSYQVFARPDLNGEFMEKRIFQ